MTYGLVIARDTEKEAQEFHQRVIDDGDWGAAGNVIKIASSGASQFFGLSGRSRGSSLTG
jgi:FMNH2-dependent dimethyl sulfone monooxygenase